MWIQQRDYKKLGELMFIAREAAGLTQQILAKRLGKPQSFVSSYERGQRRVDLLEFFRIASAIGVEPIKLFSAIFKASAEPKSRVPKR